MMAPTSSEHPARHHRRPSWPHRWLSGGGLASHSTTPGRPRPIDRGRSQ
jgi:hypothetical protein